MNNKEFTRWATVRAQGRLKFIFLVGVLCWGLPMFLFMTFLVIKPFKYGFDLKVLLFNLLVWFIGGLLFGFMVWKTQEKKYLETLENWKAFKESFKKSEDGI